MSSDEARREDLGKCDEDFWKLEETIEGLLEKELGRPSRLGVIGSGEGGRKDPSLCSFKYRGDGALIEAPGLVQQSLI